MKGQPSFLCADSVGVERAVLTKLNIMLDFLPGSFFRLWMFLKDFTPVFSHQRHKDMGSSPVLGVGHSRVAWLKPQACACANMRLNIKGYPRAALMIG